MKLPVQSVHQQEDRDLEGKAACDYYIDVMLFGHELAEVFTCAFCLAVRSSGVANVRTTYPVLRDGL